MVKIILAVKKRSLMHNFEIIFILNTLFITTSICNAQIVRDTFVSYDVLNQEAAFERVFVLSSDDYNDWKKTEKKKIIDHKYPSKIFRLYTNGDKSIASYECKKIQINKTEYSFEPYLKLEYKLDRNIFENISQSDISFINNCTDSTFNYFEVHLYNNTERIYKCRLKKGNNWHQKFMNKLKKATKIKFIACDIRDKSIAEYSFQLSFPKSNSKIVIK